MKTKNLFRTVAILAVASVGFVGCGDDDDEKIPVTSVKITGTAVTDGEVKVFLEESVTIGAEVLPSDATDKSVTWSSADPTIASVADATNGATITGLKVGTTTVTVTSVSDPTQKGSVTVTVSENLAVTSEDLAALAGTYKGLASITAFGGNNLDPAVPAFPNAEVVVTTGDATTILWNLDLDLSPITATMYAKGNFKLEDFSLTVTKDAQGATTFNIEGSGKTVSGLMEFPNTANPPVYGPLTPTVDIDGTIGENGIDVTILANQGFITIHYTATKQ
jgi:hypothetical protein